MGAESTTTILAVTAAEIDLPYHALTDKLSRPLGNFTDKLMAGHSRKPM